MPISSQVEADTDKPADPVALLIKGDSPEENSLNFRISSVDNLQPIDSHRIETFSINMPQLGGRAKDIIVFLPSDYLIRENTSPVVYLQKAEDVFINHGHEEDSWLLNEDLYQFYTKGFQTEPIIVGILSDPLHNWEEYSPWINYNMSHWVGPDDANLTEGGKGDSYLDFLINTLKPEIETRYHDRVLPDRGNTTIAGAKMGGLISIYAGITRPDIFSRVYAMSPDVWFAEDGGTWLSDNRLIQLINTYEVPKNVFFYFDISEEDKTTELIVRPTIYDYQGNKITFPQAYFEGSHALITALINNGLQTTNLYSETEYPDEWSADIREPEVSRESDFSYFFPSIFHNTPSKIETFELDIEISSADIRRRKIWVYLPPNYNIKGDPYPVIYLFGGRHTFGSESGWSVEPFNDWNFDETLDSLYNTTHKGIIAVAVDADAHYPWDEYSWWNNEYMGRWLYDTSQNFTGVGDQFLNFIVTDLKNKIDSDYHTFAISGDKELERENTAIGGGSRYGLFALYAGLTKPDIFSKVMSMSPAFWVVNNSYRWRINNGLLTWFDSNTAPNNLQYYLYIGTKEWYDHIDPNIVPLYLWEEVYRRGAEIIEKELSNDIEDSLIKYDIDLGGAHHPSDWGPYVDDALYWFGFY